MNSPPALPGNFYAVGVGPGAPDLLTLRAARIIESADLIIAPQAKGASRSLALEAIRPFVHEQQLLCVSYPMQRDDQATRARWQKLAEQVAAHCRRQRAVVQVTLGDPLIFATSSYLLQELQHRLPADNIHIVPGISAFQTGASRFGEALTLQEDRLLLMSATDLEMVAGALDHCETLVLYKAGPVIEPLLALLAERKLLGSARLFSCTEQGDGELLVDNLENWRPTPLNYMTTLIVHVGRQNWRPEAVSG
ncbi:precorrin-2 C20-methyltransferase /cobalt-factor II C20-methyltransferase [Geothermobacter ehrlichii]|uniref:Precorrin-2 C20-methyltransferase /cobalt-factor II C20-methyltransferase n=1 Tax=Geothermobacter ehrlichii TaxID=213224 RepID=A0A5D3WMF6_9BACT|nr:precorrin-2 C(20)-methyltransferase [Geothermobacter ehrlichii]TYO99266.1 precorrin-2 C20-methyltransferase /cobalt-factor II C20-methyltransferase [Geothermobacter ehrlichii]